MGLSKKFVDACGHRLAYIEEGEGRPILLLHGNPTSSYLWRDVIPSLSGLGRCIAPDLIGMGDSEKLADPGPGTYLFETHSRHLDSFIDALGIGGDLTLVLHDWGSALGFDWACRHPDGVRAIAYMEGIVRPFAGWEEFSPKATPIFQAFRSEAGEEMILDKNAFVERVLPGSILRALTDAEMAEYRRPFAKREDRWPTLSWPRQIPVAGDPPEVVERVAAYADWMAENEIPKLFVNAEPGAILVGAVRAFCRSWKNQEEVSVPGVHFVQVDSGPAIGQAIADWLRRRIF